MITSFKEFNQIYYSDDNELYIGEFINNLSSEEILCLKEEINNWTEGNFLMTVGMFKDYFRITVPSSIIRQICYDNFSIASEVESNSVRDTYARDLLIDELLKKIGMGSWPNFSDDDETRLKFLKELSEQSKKYNIELF